MLGPDGSGGRRVCAGRRPKRPVTTSKRMGDAYTEIFVDDLLAVTGETQPVHEPPRLHSDDARAEVVWSSRSSGRYFCCAWNLIWRGSHDVRRRLAPRAPIALAGANRCRCSTSYSELRTTTCTTQARSINCGRSCAARRGRNAKKSKRPRHFGRPPRRFRVDAGVRPTEFSR